jgi:hypothetical protein
VFESDWTACSKYANYSRPNSKHVWEHLYDHSTNIRIYVLMMNKIIFRSYENYELVGYGHDLDLANYLAPIACFTSFEKWVRIEQYLNNAQLP